MGRPAQGCRPICPFPHLPIGHRELHLGHGTDTTIVRMVHISHHLKHCSNAAKAQNGESEPSTSDGLRGPIQPAGSPTVAGSWSIHTKSLNISNVVTCQASQTSKAARPARNMNVAAAELAGRTAHRFS